MRQRRLIPLIALLSLLALVGAACGEDTVTPGGTPTTSPAEEIPEFTTIEDGTLKVGSCLDYPPFESVVDGDETGFDVDLTEEIASRLDLEVEWVTANFDTIFTAVAGGSQFDMVAAAVTATGPDGVERDQVVDFSDFYFNSRTALTVNTEETPDLVSIDDLGEGDIVGVQSGTTGATYAEEHVPEGVEIKTFRGAPAAFTDLEAGQVTAVVNDEQSSVEIIAERPSLAIVETYDTNEKYAFAFSPDSPELIEAVNIVLAEIIADGTYAEIFAEYFPGQEVPEEFQGSA